MTTRSNVHYSVDAESLQRAIDNVLPENLQTPVSSTQSVRASTARPRMQTAISAPVAAVMDPHLLLTPLEQNFKLLNKCSKKAFLQWKPTYLNYINQGGSRTLPYCMDPPVQQTFLRLLPNFQNSTIVEFLNTSTADLFTYIHNLYKLSKIINWTTLLTDVQMKQSTNFDRELIELYIQHVSVLLNQYPTMFNIDVGGTTQKVFTKAFLDGLYPKSFRTLVLKTDPKTFAAALTEIYNQFDNFEIF